jgi:hypothetical protein
MLLNERRINAESSTTRTVTTKFSFYTLQRSERFKAPRGRTRSPGKATRGFGNAIPLPYYGMEKQKAQRFFPPLQGNRMSERLLPFLRGGAPVPRRFLGKSFREKRQRRRVKPRV